MVDEFAGDEWFATLHATLVAAGPVPGLDAERRIVIHLLEAPNRAPHAFTITLGPTGAAAAPGDHLAADAVLRIDYADAARLARGDLDSATALREGRVKVRGDVGVVVALLDWLLGAHGTAS